MLHRHQWFIHFEQLLFLFCDYSDCLVYNGTRPISNYLGIPCYKQHLYHQLLLMQKYILLVSYCPNLLFTWILNYILEKIPVTVIHQTTSTEQRKYLQSMSVFWRWLISYLLEHLVDQTELELAIQTQFGSNLIACPTSEAFSESKSPRLAESCLRRSI